LKEQLKQNQIETQKLEKNIKLKIPFDVFSNHLKLNQTKSSAKLRI